MEYKDCSIGILDYKCGNLNSLKSIIKSIGFNCFISNQKKELLKSDLLILPGVGNFSFAMKQLEKMRMIQFIRKFSKKKPLIGICLGMQILFTIGYETKKTKGLDLIKGTVERFSKDKCNIGWRNCEKKNYLVDKNQFYYFNHSFFVKTNSKNAVTYSSFDKIKFPSIIKKKKIIGFQFHPEKSQFNGKQLLKKIINMIIND